MTILVENSKDSIIMIRDGVLTFVNKASIKFVGYSPEEMVNTNFLNFVAPDYREYIVKRYLELMEGKHIPSSCEIELFRKDGKTIDVEVNAVRIDFEGSPVALAFVRDIAGRRQAEDALKESEERFRSLFESANDAIHVMDGEIFIECNARAVEMFGCKNKDDLIGHSPLDFSPDNQPDGSTSHEKALKYINAAINGKPQRFYWKHSRKDGTPIDVEVSLNSLLLHGRVYLQAILRDITERELTEKALRQSEKRIERINECFLNFGKDPHENINRLTALCGELSAAACALYNRLDGEMLCSWGQWHTPVDYNPVDTPDGHICYDVIKRAGGETLVINNLADTHYAQTDPNVISYKLQTYVGRAVKLCNDYVGSLCVVYDHDIIPGETEKRVIEIIASAIGIEEERMRAEQLLRDSEGKYRAVLEGNPDPVIVYDMQGRVSYFNPAFATVFGWTLEERLGKKMDVFVPEASWPETKMMLEKVLAGEIISNVETLRKTKNGNIIPVSISGAAYSDQHGNFLGCIINLRDISEQKKLQAQLLRAQKMESLGMLAGGVAHDLNNVLSGIVSYPDLLLMQIPKGSPLIKPIVTMQNSGKKAADIVQDLLALARRGVVTEKVVNLNDIISEYMKTPEHKKLKSYHPEVKVEISLESDLLNISGSSVHLSKALMNLISNALEAMPGGGKLFIATKNRYLDRPMSGYDSMEEGDYVALTVSDTGIGISSEDIKRIFEPFYTKKIMGRSGTGLGMAVVWGTVKDHNGYIDAKSTEGKGTTFVLYFPATRREIAKEKVILPIENYMGKGETILVVDDVKEQREIVFNLLTALGYVVNAVSSGKEAVEYFKEHSADLIILDMIMAPGIDGLDTYKEILKVHPGQKAIIASGFSETARVREAQRLGAGQYIKKPYTLEKIGVAVKDALRK